MILLLSYTLFFYKKLSSGNEYSVSYENGFFRVLSFFAVSYPSAIGAIFVQKYEVSQKNRLTVSYELGT